jgi:hypothetical protein
MKRYFSILLIASFCIALAGVAPSVATAQVELKPGRTSYRFLPRYSVLHESGGIYPREVDFRVFGTYDFVIEPSPLDVWPPIYDARFDEVEAWGSHPILAYVLPLNKVLNLEGLKGQQLPVAAPFDVFRFEGTTQDGSSVELFASIIGPWMRLRGGTMPPPGSADMFEYSIRALAHERPFADFDDSGSVDWSDLSKWQSGYSTTTPSLEPERVGDANGDRVVDGADFLSWQQQVGLADAPLAELDAAMDAALASLTANISAAPEPSAASLVAIGLVLATLKHRRRSRPLV